MLRILSIFGTRPEAIKMAPVIRELENHSNQIQSVVCSTGQHQQMLDHICELFGIVPDINLNVMQPNQTLTGLTARLCDALDTVMYKVKPDWVLVQGDTTTVLAASLVAYYHHVLLGHVEAGLRTGDINSPFPEEANRRMSDTVAELMFAPTELAKQALLREGHSEARIVVTGNTVIDAMYRISALPYEWATGPLASVPKDKRLILITAHRRESFGKPFRELCMAIRDLDKHYMSDGVHLIYPVHLNPNVRQPVHEILGSLENVTLLEPLDYLSLVQLMKRSILVLTDSGGIQEEAPGLGIPVLVMRDKTERPEAVHAGTAKLVGTSRAKIVKEVVTILANTASYDAMAKSVNLYGDGNAAKRIVAALLKRPNQGTVRR